MFIHFYKLPGIFPRILHYTFPDILCNCNIFYFQEPHERAHQVRHIPKQDCQAALSAHLYTDSVFLLLPILLLQTFHFRLDNKHNYRIVNIKEEKNLPNIQVSRKIISKSTEIQDGKQTGSVGSEEHHLHSRLHNGKHQNW